MRYFISDLHIGHRNIIDYCDRGFSSVEEMDSYILDHLNSTIKEEDTLIILGDISLNHNKAVEFLSKLKFKKVIISGNHDRTFVKKGRPVDSKQERAISEFILDGGVESVHQELRISLKNGVEVLLSHFPYAKESDPESVRNHNDRPKDNGLFLLHGHMHCHYLKNGRQIDVGFDNKFGPYSEDEIVEIINSSDDFIPSRITEFYKTSTLSKKTNPEY